MLPQLLVQWTLTQHLHYEQSLQEGAPSLFGAMLMYSALVRWLEHEDTWTYPDFVDSDFMNCS